MNDRIDALDRRVSSVEDASDEIALLRQEVRLMAESFKALRVAIYTGIVGLVGSAVVVLLFGGAG